jgi:hypothetical protein
MRRSKKLFIVSFLISLITILVYLPALQNDFVNWDDDDYVYENPYIKSLDFRFIQWAFTAFHAGNWHPLTWISHAVDYAVWELNPLGHHLTNIIFHGLSTFLVVILIAGLISYTKNRDQTTAAGEKDKRLYRTSLIAGAVTGLLFGLHPIHVESVAWVSERKDVLYAFFYLLSILWYLKYVSAIPTRKSSRVTRYWLCLFFFTLALMSKPMAVTLPVVLILLDFYPFSKLDFRSAFTNRKGVVLEKLPFLILSFGSSVVTIMAQQAGGTVQSMEVSSAADRLLVSVRVFSFYLYKMLWPVDLAPLYPYPLGISVFRVEYIGSIIVFLIITGFCIYSWKRQRVWLTVWAYYLIILLPVLGIIKVGDQAAADRYTYLSSLGPFLLVGLGTARLLGKSLCEGEGAIPRKSFVMLAAIVALTLALSALTVRQIKIWKDSMTFWEYELRIIPDSAYRAYYNFGIIYESQGFKDKALEYYQKSVKLKPNHPFPYNNMGVILMSKGLVDEAIRAYRTALTLKHDIRNGHTNLGFAYFVKGDIGRAIKYLERAIQLVPDDSQAHLNLGIAYKSLGLTNKANEHFAIGCSSLIFSCRFAESLI